LAREAQPKAVVFDLDGTLLDSMTFAPKAYADTIRSLGGPELSVQQVVTAWHVGPTPVVLAHFLGRAISLEDIECFHSYFEAAAASVQAFPAVVKMLDTLCDKGYRLGVYTTATCRAATRMLTTAGIDGHFSTVIGGDEVSEPKPSPIGLQLACMRLGVSVADAAYVGDAEVDLRCAQAAGSLGIHAVWGVPGSTLTVFRPVARHPMDVIGLLKQAHHPSSDAPPARAARSGPDGRRGPAGLPVHRS
jgi:HAD superfamily hydrolase (TIGR01549 family)